MVEQDKKEKIAVITGYQKGFGSLKRENVDFFEELDIFELSDRYRFLFDISVSGRLIILSFDERDKKKGAERGIIYCDCGDSIVLVTELISIFSEEQLLKSDSSDIMMSLSGQSKFVSNVFSYDEAWDKGKAWLQQCMRPGCDGVVVNISGEVSPEMVFRFVDEIIEVADCKDMLYSASYMYQDGMVRISAWIKGGWYDYL